MFTPLDVQGLKLFARVESLSDLGEGVPVDSWPDESGHSADLVQSNSSRQPAYLGDVDGSAAVSFDAVDDVLSTAGNVLNTDRHMIFVVAKPTASDGNDLIGTGNSAGGDLLLMNYVGKMRGHIWRGATVNVADGVTPINSLGFAIFEQEVDASKLTVRLNGVDQGSVTLAGAASGASKRIYLGSRDGASWFFSGYVRALLVYEGNATSIEKDRIRNYLISRYQIPIPYPMPPVPNAPSNLNANDNVTDVALDWTDNSTDETGFRLYRNGVVLAVLGVDETFYDDTDVVVQGHYTYYVVAYNGSGESAHSNEVNVVVGS